MIDLKVKFFGLRLPFAGNGLCPSLEKVYTQIKNGHADECGVEHTTHLRPEAEEHQRRQSDYKSGNLKEVAEGPHGCGCEVSR